MTQNNIIRNPTPVEGGKATMPAIIAFVGNADSVNEALWAMRRANATVIALYGTTSAQANGIDFRIDHSLDDFVNALRVTAVDPPSSDSATGRLQRKALRFALEALAPDSLPRSASARAVGHAREGRDVYITGILSLREIDILKTLCGALIVYICDDKYEGLDVLGALGACHVVIEGKDKYADPIYMQSLARSGALAEIRASSGALTEPLKALHTFRRQG